MEKFKKATYKLIDALNKLPEEERIPVMHNCFQIVTAHIKEDTNLTGNDIPNVLSSDDMKLGIAYLEDMKDVINIINSNNDTAKDNIDELISKLSNQQFASIIFEEIYNTGGGIEVELYLLPKGKILMLSQESISVYQTKDDIGEKEPLGSIEI